MKICNKKINTNLLIVFFGLLCSVSQSSIYVFGGINGTTPWCKPKFSIKRPNDSELAKTFAAMTANGVSAQEIKDLNDYITRDAGDMTLTHAWARLFTYIIFPFLMLIPYVDDMQNSSINVELGGMRLFPLNENIEIGGFASIGYDFGSFSGTSKGFYGYDSSDSSGRAAPDYIKFSNGLFIKAGLAAKINAFIISSGFRMLNQKISINSRKLNDNIVSVVETCSAVQFSVPENDTKDAQKFVLGWFLDVMYLFDISEKIKIYIKAGIGGDFDSVKSETISRSMQVSRNGAEIATIKPFEINVENRRNFDITLGVGIAYEI